MQKNFNPIRISIIILLCSVTFRAFCQENFVLGYLISLNGDTVQGFVDYRNWERNPYKVAFKEKSGDNTTWYNPTEIKGFGTLDEIYESAIVEAEISLTNTNNLTDNPELNIKIDTTFLQSVIKGEKCLYYYMNKVGVEQFYVKQDVSYELLIHKKYLKKVNGNNVVTENKKFIGQLSLYLQDCPKIQSKLASVEYQKKSLENLFIFYYNSRGTSIASHKKTEKLTFEFGILAGLTSTSVKFISDKGFTYLVNVDFKNSQSIAGGVSLNVVFPRNQGKWSICNELMCTSYKFTDVEYVNPDTLASNTYISFGYSYLKMNNMVRFKYPVSKLYLFLNTGISNGFALSEINTRKNESSVYGGTLVRKAIDETRKYEQGVLVGLGANYKGFSCEVRYDLGNGMSAHNLVSARTSRYSVLLGYQF